MITRSLRRLIVPALAGFSLLAAGCGRQRSAPAPTPAPAETTHVRDSLRARDTLAAPVESVAAVAAASTPAPERRWHALLLHGASELRALTDSLGMDSLGVLLAINRIDLKHVREGDTLVVPEPWAPLDSLSPFPAHLDSVPPKLLIVSNRVQAWAAYKGGARVRWGPCCSGRKDKPTPVSLYHTNWCQRSRHSTVDGSWFLEWYVNLHNYEGISFHLFDLPGRPASHSCVRLNVDDAQWIYHWCETWVLSANRRVVTKHGTPTIVLDTYAYGHRRPWRALLQDSHACDVPADSIVAALRRVNLSSEPASPLDSLAAPFDSTKVQ